MEQLWDAVAVAEYPSRRVFIELINSPEVQPLKAHRAAGLIGQLNIATRQINAG